MNASTAPKWIGAIATILDVLRRVFKEESKDSTSKFLNELRVEGVDLFTYILYAIICNRELQDLFGLNSLREIHRSTWRLPTLFPTLSLGIALQRSLAVTQQNGILMQRK